MLDRFGDGRINVIFRNSLGFRKTAGPLDDLTETNGSGAASGFTRGAGRIEQHDEYTLALMELLAEESFQRPPIGFGDLIDVSREHV